ncbi:MAG TPA: amidohydrolase family protein [Candidatus Eisenbacteria bacterium]|nr:amidohydrolase family protein [Candidatus Eisenbacteria bacterium]
MAIVDVHNHYYPPEYLDAIVRGPASVRVTTDGEGNPCLHYPGDTNVAVRGHRDLAYREEVLARHGVDVQVLTFTTPGVHVEPPARAVAFARLVNDAFAAAVARPSGRFTALATLPLNDPEASVAELERAMRVLGLPGAMLFSNVNGVPLADPRYEALYERANALDAVLYIHPTSPVGVESMTEFWLMPLLGFTFDTTLAAAHLVFRGVPRRHPRVRWVLGHLGGAIPYLAERLDRGFRAFRECREHIDRPPSEYLKRFYYDTVNFDPGALRLALEFAGADQVLAGSDYPHMIGSIERMKECTKALAVSDAQRAAIRGGSAAKLFGLGSRRVAERAGA